MKLYKLISPESFKLNNNRLFCGSLHLIFISYSGIVAACFSLLSCVQLYQRGTFLFIDGSIECYTGWQILVSFVAVCWVIPFPVAIYASVWLLHNDVLSVRGFYFCLLLPLPTVCFWLYIRFWCYHKNRSESIHLPVMSQSIMKILNTLEGPFRKSKCTDESSKCRLPWESILLGRRLILILLNCFVINTFLRISSMLLCAYLFLAHHTYVKPFSSKLLNSIETVSLSMLTIIGLLNMLPAYYYIYRSYSYDDIQGILRILDILETIVNLAFPSIVTLILMVFVCFRCLQFILWVFQKLLRIIRFCIRKF